jgi:PAS domain S-box-containing protein
MRRRPGFSFYREIFGARPQESACGASPESGATPAPAAVAKPLGAPETAADATGKVRTETTLDQFFYASPSPMSIWDLKGRIQRANPSWERVLGFTPAELEGSSLFDFVHPEDRAAAAAEFEQILASGKGSGFECRATCKDGSYRWLLIDATFLKEAQLVYATVHDITKRKTAEEALRHSEARFRSAFDNTLFGMAVVSLDGRFLQVNQNLCQITGFTEQELLQTNFAAMTHPEDVRESLELKRALIEGAVSSGNINKRYLRKNGEEVWACAHVAIVRDSQGKPLHHITLVEDLTGRRLAEESARRSQEWLKFALDAAGIGLCCREAGETRASEQQFRLYGHEPAEKWLTHERWLQSIHPEDRERVETEQRLAAEQAKAYDAQFRVVWPNGSVRWLLCRGKSFREGGTLQRAEVTVDVTARTRAEQALRESQEILQAVLNSIPVRVFWKDRNLTYLGCNAPFARDAGLEKPEDIIGKTDFAMVWREQAESYRAGDRAVIESGVPTLAVDEEQTTPSGARIHLLTSKAPLRNADEVIVGVLGTYFEVTDRKRAEEALRAREQSLSESQLIAHVGSWSWELPMDANACAWTPETYRIFGVSQDTFVPSIDGFQSLIHPDDRAAMQAWIRACLAGEGPPDLEFRVPLRDGEVRYVLGRGQLVRDAENRPVRMTGIAQDITERKRMEKAIQRHAEKLARSNEELERFAYVASHDLQEPLRMVASFTQLLSKKYSGQLDETADRYINFAVDGAKRMQALITDLLAYSRVNSKELDLREIRCETAVLGAMENLKMSIEESGASVYCDPLPALPVDQPQFTLLFQNLLGNAIKFKRTGVSPRIHISAVDIGAQWEFSVQDNGIGIDLRHADRIFQAFQRLHSRAEYPGTGIGLAVCKKVVERHGGKIWVESEVGVGSAFRFTILKSGGSEKA